MNKIISRLILSFFLLTAVFAQSDFKQYDEQEIKLLLANIHARLNKIASYDKSKSDQLSTFFIIVNEIENLKKISISFGHFLIVKTESREPLAGNDLNRIEEFIATYLSAVNTLSGFFNNKLFQENISQLNLEATTSPELLQNNLIGLASHLIFYDNLIENYKVYFLKNGKLRRLIKINCEKSPEAQALLLLIDQITNRKYKNKIKKSLDSFFQNISYYKNLNDSNIDLLVEIISSNNVTNSFVSSQYLKIKRYSFIDMIIDFINTLTFKGSWAFGSVIGDISWGRGDLYQNSKLEEEIFNNLRPLDILVEKTEKHLTDKVIPGNFGHVAIWLGTRKQLEAMNLWNDPVVLPFQQQIISGKIISEVLRKGVNFNDLHSFLDVDQLAILRQKNLFDDMARVRLIYKHLFAQLGKKYDYNFDLSNATTLSCAELIYLTYEDIRWPTQYSWSRETISPDNIVSILFYTNSPFTFVSYFKGTSESSYEKYDLLDLAKEMSFELNKNRSSEDSLVFDKVHTNCETRWVHIPDTFQFESKEFCTTTKVEKIYYPPIIFDKNGNPINDNSFSFLSF